jgi:SagB-type dehydrogenase family enzyme
MAQVINLPEPPGMEMNIHDAMESRRSRRSFDVGPITIEQASELLWATAGITGEKGHRAAPSAGATYPIDTYLIVEQVDGLTPGFYRYRETEHSLEIIIEGHFAEKLADAALGQKQLKTASAIICLFAVEERTAKRYGDRAGRYVAMEIGHIGQNIYLAAEGLGLSTVAIGAFHDDKVSELFAVEGDPLYFMPIGPRER